MTTVVHILNILTGFGYTPVADGGDPQPTNSICPYYSMPSSQHVSATVDVESLPAEVSQ